MGSIPVIELDAANPAERGRIYGETTRAIIHQILGVYKALFGETSGCTWKKILLFLEPYAQKATAFAPDLVEEIDGIAQGAGLSFEEVFAINARSEILLDLGVRSNECSALAVLPEATCNQTTLLAQNWDWHDDILPCQVILKIGGNDVYPPMVTFTEAGQLAKIGMNGSGIGLTVNNLSPDRIRPGVPWILVSRRILTSTHFSQAMGYALSAPAAHPMNFLIAHRDGEAVDIETAPGENHIIFPDGNILSHTNHYLRPCLQFVDQASQDANSSTYIRQHRLQKRLKSMDGRIDVAGIREILKDHFDYPFSICAHNCLRILPDQLPASTGLSIVMDLAAGRIFYNPGNPCQNPVEQIDLAGFFDIPIR
ncbi:MAG: hypothetical protein DSY89_09615 [Deltaproteobacteria bacterium]|nr:MAG: hypothetical protein DSY89_09615 [Deltaproteobacteria bacterium]